MYASIIMRTDSAEYSLMLHLPLTGARLRRFYCHRRLEECNSPCAFRSYFCIINLVRMYCYVEMQYLFRKGFPG